MDISAVHQAVSANNLQCLTTLVKHGARATCTDKRGLLPLDVAKVSVSVKHLNQQSIDPPRGSLLCSVPLIICRGWNARTLNVNIVITFS